MQKLSTLIFSLFMGTGVFAQLTVKPSGSGGNNFLYIKESVLFVTQGVNLHKNTSGPDPEANIYFRSGAQLIQGATNGAANTGDGNISIFQEGTSNAYDYNYWAAPVGTTVEGNGSFGITMLHSPLSQTKSLNAEITSEQDGNSKPLQISSRWIHTFFGNTYSSWTHIGAETEIPAGYGFTMKGVHGADSILVDGTPNNPGSAQRYDFRGKPNSGEIAIPMVSGEYALVGNPYPSALDLSRFLLENSGTGEYSSSCYGTISRKNASTGIAYFWDSKENGTSHYVQEYFGGYGAFSPVDPCTTGIYEAPIFKYYGGNTADTDQEKGKHYDRRYLPIGQGFMIKGASGLLLEFNNRQRIFKKEGEDSDFKSRENGTLGKELLVIPRVRLQVIINESYVRNLSLGFWPTATKATDFGMDARAFDLAATDVGWLQNQESFNIDVRPFRVFDKIPIFLKVDSSKATFTFLLSESINFYHKQLFLVDTATDTYHSLKEGPVSLELEPGNHNNRFHIAFKDHKRTKPPREPVGEDLTRGLTIFHNNRMRVLEIRNPLKHPINSIAVFTMDGRRIFDWEEPPIKSKLRLSTRKFAASLYFIKLILGDGTEISRKILILGAK